MAPARGTPGVLVLAAGKGTRFRSKTIKLLHPVAGRPMVEHVVEAARMLRPRPLVTVVGYQGDAVRRALGNAGSDFVLQRKQLGTGHAVLQAASRFRKAFNSATSLGRRLNRASFRRYLPSRREGVPQTVEPASILL